MILEDAVAAFLTHRQQSACTHETLRLYRRWLGQWQQWRAARQLPPDVASITADDLRGFLTYLATEHIAHDGNPNRPPAQCGLSPNSVASARRTLRAFWHFCDGEDWLTAKQAKFFANKRIPAPTITEEPRPTCDEPTFARLIDACDLLGDVEALRLRAVLWLLYESGARIAEACALVDEQTHLRERRALVCGKGNQWGALFWTPRATPALVRYQLARPGKRGGGLPFFRRADGSACSTDLLRSQLKRVAAEAEIVLPEKRPLHWLRHTFAHRLLDAGLDLSQVQQLMRHKQIETTLRYVRENSTRLQAMYNGALHVGGTADVYRLTGRA